MFHSLQFAGLLTRSAASRLILSRFARLGTATALMLPGIAAPAEAHVKWFAPYTVDAVPRPVGAALADPAFWLASGLVVTFFVATRVVERSWLGVAILDLLDRATIPLARRLDDFVRAAIGAFFAAVFAVGGVYLTPDLHTQAEWVSWVQLLIAACMFSRTTMPLAAAGIVALWLLALRDFECFHLFDYLALGLGTAAYLVLSSLRNEAWRRYRFQALQWAVAIALMWSSLEKFAYPEWFYPLVEEKPFLTFGLPRDMFIPMAGVAEFTLGFGLLWTPLIRRLSALALLVIFNAAVLAFGRMDLVGHALILVMMVVALVDPQRDAGVPAVAAGRLTAIPVGLTAALVVFGSAYWGSHAALYGHGTSLTVVAEVAEHHASH
jgi:hypothetical protein